MSGTNHYGRTREQFNEWAIERGGYYDCPAGTPRRHTLWQHLVRRAVTASLKEALIEPEVRSIADIGCGRGDFTIEIARGHVGLARLLGFDFSLGMLKLARSSTNDPRIDFLCGAIHSLPVPNHEIDVTLCMNTLHHVARPDQESALRELARITRGHLVLEIKNEDNPYYRWIHNRTVGTVRVFPTTPGRVAAVLESNGFRLRCSRGIFGSVWLSPLVVMHFERIRRI